MREPHSVGIDVSLDRLDVAIRPGGQCFCVSNDAAGWAELVARVQRYATGAIGLEPSGGFERGGVRALLAAGFLGWRVQPNPLPPFPPARGALAKNKPLEARAHSPIVSLLPN